MVCGGQKLVMMSILEATKMILEAKIAILEAKRPILEAKSGPHYLTLRFLREKIRGQWRISYYAFSFTYWFWKRYKK